MKLYAKVCSNDFVIKTIIYTVYNIIYTVSGLYRGTYTINYVPKTESQTLTYFALDISNGQKNRNYFIAPRPNIKWISIESQANAEA